MHPQSRPYEPIRYFKTLIQNSAEESQRYGCLLVLQLILIKMNIFLYPFITHVLPSHRKEYVSSKRLRQTLQNRRFWL